MKYFGWTVFLFFAIAIGIYPFLYLIFDMVDGFLSSKPSGVSLNEAWYAAFYTHIFSGGIALLAGVTQFSNRLRQRYVRLHRTVGKCYVIAVMLSGISGLYIALDATGGIVSAVGFAALASAWLFTTLQAYLTIRRSEITKHQHWMIRSYALCWAAVTLRIMLPLSQVIGLEFVTAYQAIAWLCWVPNLIVAEMIIRNPRLSGVSAKVL